MSWPSFGQVVFCNDLVYYFSTHVWFSRILYLSVSMNNLDLVILWVYLGFGMCVTCQLHLLSYLASYDILCHYDNFLDDTSYEQVNKYCCGFINWPKCYLLLSATCDEILSWMIEIWMKNHVVSDSNYNTANH